MKASPSVMKRVLCCLVFCALTLAVGASYAQTNVRVRGTITSLDGATLGVKSREGKDVKLQLSEATRISAAKAITLADLKPGDFVGATTMRGPDGALVAREVHTLPATSTPGYTPWDLEPGSMMTNANIAKTVKATNGHELTLEYGGNSQTIRVPDGTPIATNVPADRSLLVTGAYVVVSGRVNADGSMSATSVQASKDGVRPPQ
jgi:hypothetical protein